MTGWSQKTNHDCFFEMAKLQSACKMQSRCSQKPGLVEMSAKLIKKLLICWISSNKTSKAKSLRNLASQFGISVGAGNILKGGSVNISVLG